MLFRSLRSRNPFKVEDQIHRLAVEPDRARRICELVRWASLADIDAPRTATLAQREQIKAERDGVLGSAGEAVMARHFKGETWEI